MNDKLFPLVQLGLLVFMLFFGNILPGLWFVILFLAIAHAGYKVYEIHIKNRLTDK